jgi:hypothetical protein
MPMPMFRCAYAKVDVSVSVKTIAHVGAKTDSSAGVHDSSKTAGGKVRATNSVVCNGTGNANVKADAGTLDWEYDCECECQRGADTRGCVGECEC